MNQSLIAALACVAGVAVALLDGRRAIGVAATVAGLALAPAAGSVGGTPAALTPLVAGAVALPAGWCGRVLAERRAALPGLAAHVPVVSPRAGLFGPRSIRLVGATVCLPAASWISLNVTVGGVAVASGAVFAFGYIWLVGVLRLLRARAIEELAVGAAAAGLAASTGWMLQAGPGSVPEAAAVAGLAPLVALAAGWLEGRHRRAEPARSAAGPAVPAEAQR